MEELNPNTRIHLSRNWRVHRGEDIPCERLGARNGDAVDTLGVFFFLKKTMRLYDLPRGASLVNLNTIHAHVNSLQNIGQDIKFYK